jgi:hypothetical protein
VYLLTKNLTLLKGRASKLLPKFVGPYEVLQSFLETSNYELELPTKLKSRRLHNRFHVSLLWPYIASDDDLFPNRHHLDPYDFSAPEDAEWFIEEITSHRWRGRALELEVKWSVGESTWEPLAVCNELAALDSYLALVGARDWMDLPRRVLARNRS